MNILLAIPNVITILGEKIAMLDAVAIILLILALITGAVKGFANQAMAMFGFVATLILSFILCGKLATFINGNVPAITNLVKGLVEKALGFSSETLKSEQALREVLSNSTIPAFLHELIVSIVVESNFEISIIDTITGWALNLVSFGILLIIFTIGLKLLKKIINSIASIPIISSVDAVLGMVFSAFKCLIVIMIVLSLASALFPLNNYLKPDGVTCYLNKALELITNSSLIKNLISSIVKV
jgi:uncharacterized membrane protein required for colicin V production